MKKDGQNKLKNIRIKTNGWYYVMNDSGCKLRPVITSYKETLDFSTFRNQNSVVNINL